MPLSEEELRLLEQMERALVQEDPKFASTLRGTAFRRSARRRAILAGLGFAAGIAILITGAYVQVPVLGVLGFVVMLGCATMALTALRHQQQGERPGEDPRPAAPPRVPKPHTSPGFMDRLEERWRRRRDERGDY